MAEYVDEIKRYPNGENTYKLILREADVLEFAYNKVFETLRKGFSNSIELVELDGIKHPLFINTPQHPLLDKVISEIIHHFPDMKLRDDVQAVKRIISKCIYVIEYMRNERDYGVKGRFGGEKGFVVQEYGNALKDENFPGDIEAILGFKNRFGANFAVEALCKSWIQGNVPSTSSPEKEGRMMCIQCQNEDLFKMTVGGKEGDKSLDPILGAKGRWACIYHGELTESQMIFIPFLDEAARVRYLNHEDRVLKKLGMGKYAGQGNTVSSQNEILSRMKELKLGTG